MTASTETTVRDIVASDFRAAAVFQRFGIDFCCGGGATLNDACRSQNVDADEVLEALTSACATPDPRTPRFNAWDVGTLVTYIVSNHHAYVREALPAIQAHTRKIASVHGENHPELHEIARVFDGVADEMTSHMMKEERILFPYITALGAAAQRGTEPPFAPFGSVSNPIHMMEAEHESAGAAMARIRELTAGYTAPADACTTYRVSLQELEAFEADLHAHVHLENNILFPKAKELAGEG
jgi:regulator of cell morphogenesis and NO signaling